MRALSDPRDEQRRRAQWNTSAMIAAIKPNVASQAKAPISDATILRISRLFQGVRDGRVHPKRAPPSYENSASAAQCQKRARTHPTAGIAAAMPLRQPISRMNNARRCEWWRWRIGVPAEPELLPKGSVTTRRCG